MSKLLKINVLCIVISMLINIFPDIVGAEDYLWGNMNSSEMFNVDDYITSAEEIDNDNENDYVEPYKQFLIKYIDNNGEKLGIEKTYINPYFDMIQLSSEIDTEQYIKNLKENNENIAYIQQDYKLILSTSDTETETVPETNIEETNPFGLKTIYPKELFPTNQSQETNIADSVIDTNNVIVAVIDSGIDIEHDALKDNIFVNSAEIANNSDSDNNGYIDDISGWDFVNNTSLSYGHNQIVEYSHGTHVAGIIAGNSDEIQGVHSKAQILPLKAFESGSGYTSDIIRAINYAEEMGAKIVNCSFGSNDDNEALKETIEYSNMLFICAAGNQSINIDETPFYPASFDLDNIISVGAINADNSLAYFSNYGKTVDVAVNGMSVKSSVPENEYGNSSGTSSATAYISGVISNNVDGISDSSCIDVAKSFIDSISDIMEVEETDIKIKILPTIQESNEIDDINTQIMSQATYAGYPNSQGHLTQIAAGGYHSAVVIDDNVYLFGSIDAISGRYNWRDEDVIAPGLKMFGVDKNGIPASFSVKKVSTRGDHNLILLSDGTVRSVGANQYGQLGIGKINGQTTSGNESTWQVLGLTNIVDIAAGHQFSMALDSSGRVYAWGNNKNGQIGNGSTYTFFTTPQLVSSISDINKISAGYYHALAQSANGTVYGWGNSGNGALGKIEETKCYSPIQIDIGDVEKIFAGMDSSFFIKDDGTVYACGNNSYGQLGNGTLNSRTSIEVVDITNVDDISTGFSTLFLQKDGTVYGCGLNAYGELGIGNTNANVRSITKIFSECAAISAGGHHSLFLGKDGYIYAAGRNQRKQCGFYDISKNYLKPTEIQAFDEDLTIYDYISQSKTIEIASGNLYTFAVMIDAMSDIQNKILLCLMMHLS